MDQIFPLGARTRSHPFCRVIRIDAELTDDHGVSLLMAAGYSILVTGPAQRNFSYRWTSNRIYSEKVSRWAAQ